MTAGITTAQVAPSTPSWRSEPTMTGAERPSSSAASPPIDSRLNGLRQGEERSPVAKPLVRRGAVRRVDVPGSRPSGAPAAGGASGLKGLTEAAKTKAAHYEQRDMPADAASLARLRDDARLASYPYHRDPMALPTGWVPAGELANRVRASLKLRSAGVESPPGAIVDRDSGLTAQLLLGHRSKEIVLVLGGTTAGKKTGATLGERSRPGRNFMSTLSQWGANLYAGLGGTPRSYRQAEELLASVRRQLKSDPDLAGHAVRVIGHSKGGGEAMYAALRASDPVPVTAFCPAHLSHGLIKALPAGNLARAKELVTSYSPHGDPVAGMRGKLPGMQGVGVGHHFDGIPSSGMMHLHDQFHLHVQHHCDGAGASPERA